MTSTTRRPRPPRRSRRRPSRKAPGRFRSLATADRVALVAWFAAIGVLALIGLGVTDRLHATDALVPGTPAAKAQALSEREFGRGHVLLVFLQGEPRRLNASGPAIADRIAALPRTRVLDPWRGGGPTLKPKPGQAILLISVDQPFEQVTDETVPRLRALLPHLVRPPLSAHLTGYPDINHAIHDETVAAIERSELIAAPALLLVLLLVLGSPVAAAMPLILGGCAAGAGAGVLELLNRFTPLDISALSLATMMGLALGVDYSLLIVARFRSELAAGASVTVASRRTAARAGRTVRFAAMVLAAAMVAALVVTPGAVMKSATVGVLVAVVISVIGASVALPPLLRLVGHDINRFQIRAGRSASGRWGTVSRRVMRHPLVAGGLVLLVMLGLAVPAFNLQTGPPDPRILPDSSEAGQDFKVIERDLGGSRAVPFVVTVTADRGTLADDRLETLARFERELRRDPDTLAVLGPATVARRTAALAGVPRRLRLAGAATRDGLEGARRLEQGLAQAGDGAGALVGGLSLATRASARLAQGTGDAERGAERVRAGVMAAQDGARQLRAGLSKAVAGAAELQEGTARLGAGSETLTSSIRGAADETRGAIGAASGLSAGLARGRARTEALAGKARTATDNAAVALDALDDMLAASRRDPSYQRIRSALATVAATLSGVDPVTGASIEDGYEGLADALGQATDDAAGAGASAETLRGGIERLTEGLDRLAAGSERITAGVARLDAGAGRLHEGSQRLLDGSATMVAKLGLLADGTEELLGGAGRLDAGSRRLADALGAAADGSRSLAAGVGELRGGAEEFGERTERTSRRIGDPARLVSLFGSGYASLAAIDTAPDVQRAAASWAINLDHGGTSVQFLVVQRATYREGSQSESLPSRADNPYRDRLEERVEGLARRIGATAAVGGPATSLADFDESAKDSLPLLIAALVLITYLALIFVLRSFILPLVAVALNLLTVLAAFSVLGLAFGTDPLLGGPGFVDDIMVVVVFTVTFALSIDYAIFILDRMREGYELHGTVEDGIVYGVDHTAGVITGAAAIMAAVFLAFAISTMVTMRQLGLGLTVAVILDATLVRLVLLPAILRLLGERAWHVPRILRPSAPPSAERRSG